MSSTIYYFSGTGNSLRVARDIAERLDDAELVPLARASDEQLSPASDAVGIVFPVYAWGPPRAVVQLLERLVISPDQYLFAVCTCGGCPGGTLVRIRKQLRARGMRLSTGFAVYMPSNYIVFSGARPEEEQRAMFEQARVRVDEIVAAVRAREERDVEKSSLVKRAFLSGVIHPLASSSFRRADRQFVVSDDCKRCGTCARVCPAGNITMEDSGPTWNHDCEQ
ncbi:MAG: EFR1 family ferrodoxin, partial [Planctomycetota bacterium]